MEAEGKLTGVRQSMRVLDANDLPVGYVRDVNGRSVLVKELAGNRVAWIPAEAVAAVVGNDVRLAPASAAQLHLQGVFRT